MPRTFRFQTPPAPRPQEEEAAPAAPRWTRWLPALLPFLILVGTGWVGIDFGRHWDEGRAFVAPLARSVSEGSWLPGKYNYPSFGYLLTRAALMPEQVAGGALEEVARSHAFLLRARLLFLLVSALGVVWLYAAVLTHTRSALQALAAACLMGFSFEVAYHLRWVAPDGLLMQFGALTLLLSLVAYHRPEGSAWWLRAAAIAAGLGCGAKYPGGLLLLPVLVACWARASTFAGKERVKAFVSLSAQAALLLALAFLVTTPGAVLDTETFRRDVQFEMKHYREDGHGPYTVEAGLPHAAHILQYLGGVAFSPHAPIAWLLFLLVPIGIVACFRERFSLGLLVLSFPLAYTLYMSSTVVMIVRNLLVLLPFLAFFAALGAARVSRWLRVPELRAAASVACLALVLINAHFVASAAVSVADQSLDASVDEFVRYAHKDRGRRIYLSPRLSRELEARDIRPPRAVTPVSRNADFVALLVADCTGAQPPEYPLHAIRWFGPRPVNYAYYPTWPGAGEDDCRILCMPRALAVEMGLRLEDASRP